LNERRLRDSCGWIPPSLPCQVIATLIIGKRAGCRLVKEEPGHERSGTAERGHGFLPLIILEACFSSVQLASRRHAGVPPIEAIDCPGRQTDTGGADPDAPVLPGPSRKYGGQDCGIGFTVSS